MFPQFISLPPILPYLVIARVLLFHKNFLVCMARLLSAVAHPAQRVLVPFVIASGFKDD